MLFNQSNKIPDVGKNSFKEYINDLQLQTKSIDKQFKNSLYGHQFCRERLEQQEVPNLKYAGQTWDCQHMDKFLLTSRWSGMSQTSQSHRKPQQLVQEINSSKPGTSQGMRNSFFFMSIPRTEKVDEIYKQRDFSDQYTNRNILVQNQDYNQEVANTYFTNNFIVEKMNFDKSKLEMTDQSTQLAPPVMKRKQLEEVKSCQQELQKWQKQYAQQNKSYRVHKAAYKSGILSVDQPTNVNSELYKKEAEEIQKREKHVKQIQERHRKQVEQYFKTCNKIEFYKQKNQPEPQTPLDQEKINPLWTKKAAVQQQFLQNQQNSQDRLFGHEVNFYSIKRAEYLRQCETKGRNFNILSQVDNKIEFKRDKGVKNHEK